MKECFHRSPTCDDVVTPVGGPLDVFRWFTIDVISHRKKFGKGFPLGKVEKCQQCMTAICGLNWKLIGRKSRICNKHLPRIYEP